MTLIANNTNLFRLKGEKVANKRYDNKRRLLRKGETQRTKDLKYVYTYFDLDGKRRSIYSKDLATLRKREEEIEKEQREGLTNYIDGNVDLNYVFDRYISLKTELRATTRQNYKYMYGSFISNGFGKRKIKTIRYSDVMQFYQSLITKQGLQINTLETIHSLIHPTLQLAVRDCIIRTNPSDGVMAEIKKKNHNKGIRHALTIEQQRAFIRYIDDNRTYMHWSSFMKFLLGTGCRIGEAIGIRWKDLDFEKREININHSLVYYTREYRDHARCSFGVSLPKTNAGIRIIPMIEPVYEVLKEEWAYQEENGFNKTEIDGMKGFVFQNRFGNVHNPQSVNRAIKRIYESYNAEELIKAEREHRDPEIIPHFSCHHLRHTFCSRLCEDETNLKIIQSIMGHANIETTMDIYAEVNETKKQESMNNLARKIKIF